MIIIQKFVFSSFMENTYIVWDDSTKETAIVDPGCIEKHEEDKLKNFISTQNLNPKYLINTHCHIDHVFGNAFVKAEFLIPLYIPEKDEFLLKNMQEQSRLFGIDVTPSPPADSYISEDLLLKLGNDGMKFLFTPGHTPGEYCIHFEKDKILISGDVLFEEGIGRTDLWGGNYNTLIKSIKEKLLTLPGETTVYPGHGNATTIEHEKKYNPFLR